MNKLTTDQEERVLEIVRAELLDIFKEANKKHRGGSSNIGTSSSDMFNGKGTSVEYLLEVLKKRMK